MRIQFCQLPFAIAERFAQVMQSGTLTLVNRFGVFAALLADVMSDEEKFLIDRLLRATR